LSASFTIKNGIAHNDDLSMKSPFLRLAGAGDINIGASTINYLAKASVVASSGGQGGKDLNDLAGLTIPVRLSGPLDSPSYSVEMGSILGSGAAQGVTQRAGKALESAKDSVKEQIGDRLKGILGR
jgi:AsmA protein